MSKEGDEIKRGVIPKPTEESKLIIESLDGLHRLRPTNDAPPAGGQPTAEPQEGTDK